MAHDTVQSVTILEHSTGPRPYRRSRTNVPVSNKCLARLLFKGASQTASTCHMCNDTVLNAWLHGCARDNHLTTSPPICQWPGLFSLFFVHLAVWGAFENRKSYRYSFKTTQTIPISSCRVPSAGNPPYCRWQGMVTGVRSSSSCPCPMSLVLSLAPAKHGPHLHLRHHI